MNAPLDRSAFSVKEAEAKELAELRDRIQQAKPAWLKEAEAYDAADDPERDVSFL